VLLVLLLACRARGTSPLDDGVPTVLPGTDTTTAAVVERCPDPTDADADGWDATSAGGQDCDDEDPAVNPDATDADGGVDADCDGDPTEPPCPGTAEVCNAVDDDCDGLVDDHYVVSATATNAVSALAQVLEDGAWGLVVGVQGPNASTDGELHVYDLDGRQVVRIVGAGQSPTFGAQIATGRDLTGDGVVDLVVSAPYATVDGEANSGRVWVFAGPLAPETLLTDAVAVFEGGELDGQPGAQLALAPDLTGDGQAELLIGYYRQVLLYSGTPPASARVADVTARVEINTGGGVWHFATTPDADGDGLDELALGMDSYAGGLGLVARYDSSGLAGHLYLDDAGATLTGGALVGIGTKLTRVEDTLYTLAEGTVATLDFPTNAVTARDWTADAIADGGDLDGDGRSDLLLADAEGLRLTDGRAWAEVLGLQTDRGLQPGLDVDGDGVPEVALVNGTLAAALDGSVLGTAPCNADGDALSAAEGDCDDTRTDVLPVRGRETCDGLDNDCDGVVDGPAEVEWPAFVEAASGLGDLDGDGTDELVVAGADGDLTALDGEALTSRFTVTGAWMSAVRPVAGAGDTDGDGFVELLVAGEDESWLLPLGESGRAVDLARVHFRDGTSWARQGDLGRIGDVDGDGGDDAWLAVRSPTGRLGVAVYTGLEPGVPTLDDAAAVLITPESWDLLVVASPTPGDSADLDGDGRDDLVVGNPRSAYGGGRVMGFLTVPQGERLMDDRAEVWLYGDPLEGMGNALAYGGDADGDGRADLLIGGVGASRLLHGRAGCPVFTDPAWPVPGAQVALADVDGDGLAEAWLGDASGVWNDVRGGVIRVARPGGEAEDWRAGASGEAVGTLLVGLGDTDGEGGEDLLYTTATSAFRVGARCP